MKLFSPTDGPSSQLGETDMPVFRVCSGDLDVTLTRQTHQEAASDAFGTLRSGNFDKMKLGVMTSVLELGDPDELPVFIETMHLV
jgi:hypothetical protein